MTAGLPVLLLGVFGVPLVLLWWGKRVRRLPRQARRAFWGAILGHIVGGAAAIVVSMLPPEAWTEADTMRGFFGFFGLLAFPAAGGLGGWLTAARPSGMEVET